MIAAVISLRLKRWCETKNAAGHFLCKTEKLECLSWVVVLSFLFQFRLYASTKINQQMTLKRKVWKQISYLPTLEYWPKLQKRKYTKLLTSQIRGAWATAGQTRRVVLNTTRYFFTRLNTMLYYGHVLPSKFTRRNAFFWSLAMWYRLFLWFKWLSINCRYLDRFKVWNNSAKKGELMRVRPQAYSSFVSFLFIALQGLALSVHPNARIRISIRQVMW